MRNKRKSSFPRKRESRFFGWILNVKLKAWTPVHRRTDPPWRTFIAGVSFIFLFLPACKRNPVDRLINPVPDGAVAQFGTTFMIYDDELKTGGGLGFFPGGENQSIDLQDFGSPRRTANAIRYTWNGQDVSTNTSSGSLQHNFAGFSLTITPDFSTFDSAQPKNISQPLYTKVRLWVRGTLASDTYLRIEGPDDGNESTIPARFESIHGLSGNFTLTNDWQEITFAVPAGDFSAVKSYLTVSLQYQQPTGTTVAGGGGRVYLDDIQYEQ